MEHLEEFKRWLVHEGKNEKTIVAYEQSVRLLISWWEQREEGRFHAADITALDLHEWRAYLQTVKKYSASTINRHVAGLKTYWAFLTESGLVPADPTRKVRMRRPSMLNASPRWLTRKEQARFLHELEKERNPRKRKRNIAIVQCMLQAGCRVAEVAGLDVGDVDFKRRTLTVRQGKRGKMRVVPMNRDLTKALTDWMDERKKLETSEGALFVSERKHRLTVRAIQHFVRQIFDNIGVADGTCHSLRHSFCKNLLDSGQPITVVAQLAGHEDLESCRRYLLPGESDLRIAVEGISSTR